MCACLCMLVCIVVCVGGEGLSIFHGVGDREWCMGDVTREGAVPGQVMPGEGRAAHAHLKPHSYD